jgi:tetratricopeptide (TPR) repeat protein
MTQPEHIWEALAGDALARAQAHFLRGDHHSASDACSTALKARPAEPIDPAQRTLIAQLYCQRAHTQFIRRDLTAAIDDYNQAIAHDPSIADAYINRGLIAYQAGKPIAAVADYSAAIDLYLEAPPSCSPAGATGTPAWCLALAQAYFNRGNAQYQRRDFAEAVHDYSAALALHPSMIDALIYRGVARYRMDDGAGAEADYAEALRQPAITSQQRAMACYNCGLLLRQRGDLHGAIAAYDAALAAQPNDADCLINRGNARAEAGDLLGAIEDYGAGLRLNPWIENGFNIRGMARMAAGDLRGAAEDFDRAIAQRPQLADAHFNRGCVRLQLGDLDGAIEDFSAELAHRAPGLRERVEAREQRAELYNNRGLAYHYRGNLPAAIDDYSRSLDQLRLAGGPAAVAERMASTLLNRGLAYYDQAQAASIAPGGTNAIAFAVADLEQAADLSPDPALAGAAREYLAEIERLRYPQVASLST